MTYQHANAQPYKKVGVTGKKNQLENKTNVNQKYNPPQLAFTTFNFSNAHFIYYIFAHMCTWIYKERNALASRSTWCLSTIYNFISCFIFVELYLCYIF